MDRITFVVPCVRMNPFKLFNVPSYGAVLLATILHEKGYDVSVKDEQNMRVKIDDLRHTDVLLISSLTSGVDRGYEIARAFKKRFGRPVIMGGMHVSVFPREALANGADIAVAGEAEITLPAVLENLRRILEMPAGDRIIQGELVKDLDALPFADFGLVERPHKFAPIKKKNSGFVSVMPFRGCINRCRFCSTWKFGGLRSRSTENVIEELDTLLNAGYAYFFFSSDYFSWHKKRSGELLEAMKSIRFRERSGWAMTQDSVKVAFTPDGEIDHDYLNLLYEAGIRHIGLGIEVLQEHNFGGLVGTVGKKQEASQSLAALQAVTEHGIKAYSFLMAGVENQTAGEIIENARIAKRYGEGQVPILTPFPGTQLYDELKNEGKIFIEGPGNWKYYDALNVLFRHETLSPKALKEATAAAWKVFYSYEQALLHFMKALGGIALFNPKKVMGNIPGIILHLAQARVSAYVKKRKRLPVLPSSSSSIFH